MSNARPHVPMPQGKMTPRQRRRFVRKLRRYQDVEVLHIREHGGSGVPVRKPRNK